MESMNKLKLIVDFVYGYACVRTLVWT